MIFKKKGAEMSCVQLKAIKEDKYVPSVDLMINFHEGGFADEIPQDRQGNGNGVKLQA